jgi:acyl-CoA synthetase (AMP-forming)/AMP-acid ligase II
MEYPGVSKAAVYAVSSEIYGEVPAAAIIPEQGAHINPVEVKEYLRTRIATYEMPDLIEIVSEFPVTQNGKVRKAELRRRTEEGGW